MDKNNQLYVIILSNGEYFNLRGSRSIFVRSTDKDTLQIYAYKEKDDGIEEEVLRAIFIIDNIAGYTVSEI